MLALLPSVTTAMRVKRILGGKGIKISVVQTSKSFENVGCSYSVRFEDKYLTEIQEAVSMVGSKVKAIYYE